MCPYLVPPRQAQRAPRQEGAPETKGLQSGPGLQALQVAGHHQDHAAVAVRGVGF